MSEVVQSRAVIRGALVAPHFSESERGTQLVELLRARGVETHEVSETDFTSAAQTDSPQGILAIAEVPHVALGDLSLGVRVRLAVLDGLQDPGNAGTIIRTAAAFGLHAVLAMPGTVDLWNAKVVRSAMGAQLALPLVTCSWDELRRFIVSERIMVWAADAAGAVLESLAVPDRLAIVIGNEGVGLSDSARFSANALVSLPIAPRVESLNAGVAAGILFYQLRT